MTWVYFMKQKSEVYTHFLHFFNLIKTQYQHSIKILKSDNGREFVNSAMKLYFQENGMIHQTSCAYTPEQNGVAERKNCSLLEMTRSMLIESKAPKHFWPEAIATSAYLLNRLPTSILKHQTPLQALSSFTKIPLSLTLEPRVFGCSVFIHTPKHE